MAAIAGQYFALKKGDIARFRSSLFHQKHYQKHY
jgi:hypothetical protein